MEVLTFLAFWFVVALLGSIALGKHLKRQRLRQQGTHGWSEEWTS